MTNRKHTWQCFILPVILLAGSLVAFGQTPKSAIKSPQAVNAIATYEAAEKKAKADYEKAVSTARAAAIKQLEAAMAVATKAGNLDEAVAIRDKITELKAEEDVKQGKLFIPVADMSGTWREQSGWAWILTADGKFTSENRLQYGTWAVTATSFRMTWTTPGWKRADVYTIRDGETLKGKRIDNGRELQEMTLRKDAAK